MDSIDSLPSPEQTWWHHHQHHVQRILLPFLHGSVSGSWEDERTRAWVSSTAPPAAASGAPPFPPPLADGVWATVPPPPPPRAKREDVAPPGMVDAALDGRGEPLFDFTADLLWYTTEQFADSLDAAQCPAAVKQMLVAAHAHSRATTATTTAVAGTCPADGRRNTSLIRTLGTSRDEEGSLHRRNVGYTVRRIVPRAQHSLFRAQRQLSLSPSAPALRVSLRPSGPAAGPANVAFLLGEECLAREAIVAEETAEAVHSIPFLRKPPATDAEGEHAGEHDVLDHPALLAAAERCALREDFHRRAIAEEEAVVRETALERQAHILHSAARTGGFLAAERHLRHWIARRRAKKRLLEEQQRALIQREVQARVDLIQADRHSQARFSLLVESLHLQESHYRREKECVQLKTAFAVGLVALRLEEQCARFPLFFKGLMSRTRACGMVRGFTLFHNLSIHEGVKRQWIEAEETTARRTAPLDFALQQLEQTVEPAARSDVELQERESFFEVCQTDAFLITYYMYRDVEVYEAAERSLDLKKALAGLQCAGSEEGRTQATTE